MWVFCCGPVRSGSTLQFNITRELVEKSNSGYAVAYDYTENFSEIFENFNDKKLKVFKTHSLSPLMIELIKNKKAVAIYCYRDIRDVIVSIAKKENGNASNLIKNDTFILDYIVYFHLIKNLPFSLMSKYENFYNNILQECIRISSFLNISVDLKTMQQIETDFSRDVLISKMDIKKMEDFIGKNGRRYKINKKTLIHFNHFGNYFPGSYENDLLKNEINKIEKLAGYWLISNGYKINWINFFIAFVKHNRRKIK